MFKWVKLLNFADLAKSDVHFSYKLYYLCQPTDHMGATPLHEAVVYNHVTLVELLLGHDCDVMAADNQGSTALHLAAMNGDIDIMKMLINHARKEKKDGVSSYKARNKGKHMWFRHLERTQ